LAQRVTRAIELDHLKKKHAASIVVISK